MLSYILITATCMQLLTFSTCTRSGLPHNVVHSSSGKLDERDLSTQNQELTEHIRGLWQA